MLNIKANIADTKKVLSIYIMIINVAIDLKKTKQKTAQQRNFNRTFGLYDQ